MTEPLLSEFSARMALWAQSLIDDGRFPFRRAELYADLLPAPPSDCPPLVLWINRDSFMAGGVILFTDDAENGGEAVFRTAAASLGLSQAAVWGRQGVTFWNYADAVPLRGPSLAGTPLGESSPATYQHLLLQILQELRMRCVSAALATGSLPAPFFASLLQGTCSDIYPLVLSEVRVHRSAEAPSALSGETPLALGKICLTLLRLVVLTTTDRLPPTTHPEGLENALRFAIETLPPHLQESLAFTPHEIDLDLASAIRFHCLLRRLVQLDIKQSRTEVAAALQLLLDRNALMIGGFPLPVAAQSVHPDLLLVNADRPQSPPPEAEIASRPLMSFFAVIRTLNDEALPRYRNTAPFDFDRTCQPHTIVGTLYADRHPSGHERAILTTLLRRAWPGRRWEFPPRTPYWIWEFLHLLGLAAPDAEIRLTLPGNWLDTAYAPLLLDLFGEEVKPLEISLLPEGRLNLSARRGNGNHANFLLRRNEKSRVIPWELFAQQRVSTLALALTLPDELFALLTKGALRLRTLPQSGDTALAHGADLFTRSTLGQTLQKIVDAELCLPLPEDTVLRQLATSFPAGDPSFPAQNSIDHELARWLPVSIASAATQLERKSPLSVARHKTEKAGSAKETAIAAEIFSDGIPLFPEHYLLDHYRPALSTYELTEPLSLYESFFDTITLTGANGSRLEVCGELTARALILVSHVRRGTVRLPTDPTLLSSILDRYLNDLRRLHLALKQCTRRQLVDARAADATCTRLWARQGLPPATLLFP